MTKFYRSLNGEDSSDFCHKLSSTLSKGWALHGDLQYSYDSKSTEMLCAQALVKSISQDYHADKKLGDQ
ncbi:DUF1737 domain-containing protein [Paracoccaceae bacterium]|nr:DUF1737 domain-containing protein [Paracoccaceae bacterium]MDB3861143.1 DUF1737 domain-containing protein [Paracoccaceae bacterium]